MQQEMNTAEIGLSLGVSKRTVQRWISSGKLKAQEIAPDRYRIEESDLQALTSEHDNARPAPESSELTELRKEFYELAHQVSELERIMEEIVESLTAIPEQIEQVRLTVPLQLEESQQGNSQAEARIATLEERVSELESIVEALTTNSR